MPAHSDIGWADNADVISVFLSGSDGGTRQDPSEWTVGTSSTKGSESRDERRRGTKEEESDLKKEKGRRKGGIPM